MPSFCTLLISVLSVAAAVAAYADPNQRDRNLFERELQRRDVVARKLIERGLYEQELMDRRMFERELALRDLYPTRTLNIPRALTSTEVQNDVMDPAISAAAIAGAAVFIPGAAGKVAGPVLGHVLADGYNHLAENKQVDAVAAKIGHTAHSVAHEAEATFHKMHLRDLYARHAEPEFLDFDESELYTRDAAPKAEAEALAEAYADAYAEAYASAYADAEPEPSFGESSSEAHYHWA
ncbi:hypothetical protein MMC26_007367 [Xylographa opegraphella]|nr:hypothetical protein [Xylographa opegraphella]